MTIAANGALHTLCVLFGVMVLPEESNAQQPSAGRSVVTAAGDRYRAGAIHRLVLGRHYRDLWTTPVEVEVLDLSTFAGGITPLQRGGGMSTRSLRFLGSDGREYSFRSVDKDPTPLLADVLRETVVADLVQDGISSAHPYGALVAAPLMEAVGVLHVTPLLRVMPDIPALGEFRAEFAGMLGLIEERPDENDGERAPFEGAVRVIGHERLTERVDESPRDRVDARAFLTARIVDVFLGDWDRHRRQWRWATYDDGDERSWIPIPTDRDQAFSKFDGIIPRVLSLYQPQFVRFEATYPSIDRLHWNGRALDRRFLSELDRPVWDSIAASVQASLTNAVIEDAVGHLPAEILAKNGPDLMSALKVRRDDLMEPVAALYELLVEAVDLHATDIADLAVIDRTDPDFVTVSLADAESPEAPYLQRRFSSDETREIRVYMKRRDDRIIVRGEGGSGIKIRVIGGPGDDVFQVEDSQRGLDLYDSGGQTTVSGSSSGRIDDRSFDEWVWSEEDRDQPRDWGGRTLPIFMSLFNSDMGFFLGAGVRFERYGFRNDPFSSAFDVSGGFSPTERTGRVGFAGRLHRSNSPVFSAFQIRYSGLDVLNFHGFGNDTPTLGDSFHEIDHELASFEASVGVSGGTGLELALGLVASRSSTAEGSGLFFSGLRDTLYGAVDFWQVGTTASLVYDPAVDPNESSNRLRLDIQGATFPSVLDVVTLFTRADGTISALLSPSVSWPISVALRVGGKKLWGDQFPWDEAAFLGGTETVRGFRRQRFAGDAAVFGTGELRVRLGNPRIVVPVDMGLFGFADGGRVYFDGASPGGWHTGVGGGVWVSPLGQPYLLRAGFGVSDVEGTQIYIETGLPF
jgi:hypothetical protein